MKKTNVLAKNRLNTTRIQKNNFNSMQKLIEKKDSKEGAEEKPTKEEDSKDNKGDSQD